MYAGKKGVVCFYRFLDTASVQYSGKFWKLVETPLYWNFTQGTPKFFNDSR